MTHRRSHPLPRLAALLVVTLVGVAWALSTSSTAAGLNGPPAAAADYVNSTTDADCVVTFNEVFYHPADADGGTEWIELHNQMSVDEDLSGWSIEGGVRFRFPPNTVLRAGGYVVVAADAERLRAETGLAADQVYGPLIGQLDNAGDRLVLRNLHDRLLDEMRYRDEPPWPVGADGSGASLAKPMAQSPSSPPENWRASLELGGTPGRVNFPAGSVPEPPTVDTLVGWGTRAQWIVPSAALAALEWTPAGFDDTPWSRGTNGFGFDRSNAPPLERADRFYPFENDVLDASGNGLHGSLQGEPTFVPPVPPLAAGSQTALHLDGTDDAAVMMEPQLPTAYTLAVWVRIESVRSCSLMVFTDGSGPTVNWSHQLRLNAAGQFEHYAWDGGGHLIVSRTVAQPGRWYHVAGTAQNQGPMRLYVDGKEEGTAGAVGTLWPGGDRWMLGSNSGDTPNFFQGGLDEAAIWQQALPAVQVATLASGASPLSGGGLAGLFVTDLAPAMHGVNASVWFRTAFSVPSQAAYDQLQLKLRYDDGFVAWLNGQEIARRNAPAVLTWDSAATAPRDPTASALPETFDLTSHLSALRPGKNILAIHGLNAGRADADFLMSPELVVRRAPLTTEESGLSFSEVPAGGTAPYWCELVNPGPQALRLDAYRFRGAHGFSDTLGSQTLGPGELALIAFPATWPPPPPGELLALVTADARQCVDAVRVRTRPQARREAGGGRAFLVPRIATPGEPNAFNPTPGVVLNEMLYHARPVYRRPGTPPERRLRPVLAWDSVWSYDASGTDRGTAWREPAFADGSWPRGAGVLGYRTATLPEPIRTSVPLGHWTYYFRIPLVVENPPQPCPIELRTLIDDGAVFYLNGAEFYRQRMPAGEVVHTTPAINVGDPTFVGPLPLVVTNLVHGTNWLAVEVHQWNLGSSDVVCGAELAIAETVKPGTPDLPFAENPEQWVELFNLSPEPVSLAGWRLADAVEFTFPSGLILDPGQYLLVARDAEALRARLPGVSVVGNFTGRLSHASDHLELLDADGNPVDAVRYHDKAPWPEAADGGGSSLEKRDPRADPNAPAAWAASRESHRTSWGHYRFKTRAVEPVYGPPLNGFSELRLGLLADGECLVDNLTVVEDPGGAPRSILPHGTFERGATGWRLLGNHSHSRVVVDPDRPDNHVLHVVATDARGYLHNQLEATLKSGTTVVPVVAGREYEIAFDARWLSGSPQLHAELYYNRVARTFILDQPAACGTPGQPNSVRTENLGPTLTRLRHEPLLPRPSEPITVAALAQDPDGVAQLTLHHSLNGGAWQQSPMTLTASGHGSVTLPPQNTPGAQIQFYLVATDALGATSMMPLGGPDSRALVRVENRAPRSTLRSFHLLLTAADGRWLDDFGNMMSDDRLGATVIWDHREVFYDCGVHLHGSMFSRNNPDTAAYNIRFPADHRFRGTHRTVQLKRRVIQEIIAKHVQVQSGVPGMYDDLVHLFSHRPANAGPARLSLAHYNDVFLASQFDRGADGTLYNMEGIRVAMATDDGTLDGAKLPFPIDWVGDYDITDLGDDPEQYRWSTMLRNNRARDEYAPYIALAKAFSRTGTTLQQAVPGVMDVEEWLRVFALLSLFGIDDAYTQGNPHNLNLYARPSDQKILALPYDWDFFFARDPSAPLWGNQNFSKIVQLPPYTRAFHGQLLDLIETTFNPTYLTPWINHFSTVTGEDYRYAIDRVRARGDYVRSQLPSRLSFAITTNGGETWSVTTPTATLEGRAWIDVNSIHLADHTEPLPLTWLDATRWRVVVPLPQPTNALTLVARNRRLEPVGEDLMTIVTTLPDDRQRAALRITEIMYHPPQPNPAELAVGFADAEQFEFIEVANLSAAAVSMEGVRFDRGITFDFTGSPASPLPSFSRTVVVRDAAAFRARYGELPGPIAGVYLGALENSGETLRLVDRYGVVIQEFTYDDRAPWPVTPDGGGASLEISAGGVDPALPGSWQASRKPGGSPGLPPFEPPQMRVVAVTDGILQLRFVAQRGQAYRLQATEDLAWGSWEVLLSVPPPPADQEQDLPVPLPPGPGQRFYRLSSP